jgi:signal transduction histidine kinase
MRRDPARALKALDDVIATGRTSLAELRQLLGLLRADAPAEFSPRVGLMALPALVEQVRNAGLPVDLIIAPPRLALPAALDLSAYRTIQEALTNTLKHAGPGARARVTVRHADDMLSVTVHDFGGRPLADTAADGEQLGHGLHGIRERATAHGGSATVGRHGDGGFCVEVTVPLPITAPAASTA